MSTDYKSYLKQVSYEKVWFFGHCLTLASALLYALSFCTSTKLYKLIFVGVLLSFGVQLTQKYILTPKTKTTKKKSLKKIVDDVNFQYFFIALIWIITASKANLLSIPPFLIFSSFHILSYVYKMNEKSNGKSNSFIPDSAMTFLVNLEIILRNHRGKLVNASSMCEVYLFVQLLFKAITFQSKSWIQLTGYLIFIKMRLIDYKGSKEVNQENNTQLLINNFISLDQRITMALTKFGATNPSVKSIQNVYEKTIKNVIIKQFINLKIPFLRSSQEEKVKKQG